jgi:hypothetical protein
MGGLPKSSKAVTGTQFTTIISELQTVSYRLVKSHENAVMVAARISGGFQAGLASVLYQPSISGVVAIAPRPPAPRQIASLLAAGSNVVK